MKNLTNLTPTERKFYDKFIELEGLKLAGMFFKIIENMPEESMKKVLEELKTEEEKKQNSYTPV